MADETLLQDLKPVLMKLLSKAGKDPRLTPRLLREKAAQRLSLDKEAVKKFREQIKDIIMEWWDVADQNHNHIILQLSRFAKASGCTPAMFAELGKIADKEEKITLFRER